LHGSKIASAPQTSLMQEHARRVANAGSVFLVRIRHANISTGQASGAVNEQR
jgi:hypothetical protein